MRFRYYSKYKTKTNVYLSNSGYWFELPKFTLEIGLYGYAKCCLRVKNEL